MYEAPLFTKRILCDFCIDIFGEFLCCRDLEIAILVETREQGLTLKWIFITSSPRAFGYILVCIGLEVGDEHWAKSRVFSNKFLTDTSFALGKNVHVLSLKFAILLSHAFKHQLQLEQERCLFINQALNPIFYSGKMLHQYL